MNEVSTTSLKTYQTCKRKYYYAYKLLLKPKKERVPLTDGQIIHKALDNYYSQNYDGKKVQIPGGVSKFVHWGYPEDKLYVLYDVFDIYCNSLNTIIPDDRFARLMGMVAGYVKKFSHTEFVSYDAEKSFKIPFRDDFVVGKRDGVVVQDTNKRLLEYKTTASTDMIKYKEQIENDIQPLLYIWAYYMEHGEWLRGAIYRVIKKPKLRQRGGEQEEAFWDRIMKGYLLEPDQHYFQFRLDKNYDDLLWFQDELEFLMGDINREKALWIRDTQRCGDYGGCEFMPLCEKREVDSLLIEKFYQQKIRQHEEVSYEAVSSEKVADETCLHENATGEESQPG